MKQVLLAFVLLVIPFVSHAKFYQVPSGLWVEVPDPIKITRWFTLPSGLLYFAEIHVAEASELTLEERIKIWITSIAQEYGIDSDDMLALAMCESKLNPNAKGDHRSETDTFMARGLYQFWKSTFIAQSQKYNFKGEYLNWQDQTVLAAKMLKEKNGWKHWYNCGKFIGLNK